MSTASDYVRQMAELQKSKPRPIQKLYGAKGPTPEQLKDHKAKERAWNSEYRKLSKLQKETLAVENQARRLITGLQKLL